MLGNLAVSPPAKKTKNTQVKEDDNDEENEYDVMSGKWFYYDQMTDSYHMKDHIYFANHLVVGNGVPRCVRIFSLAQKACAERRCRILFCGLFSRRCRICNFWRVRAYSTIRFGRELRLAAFRSSGLCGGS